MSMNMWLTRWDQGWFAPTGCKANTRHNLTTAKICLNRAFYLVGAPQPWSTTENDSLVWKWLDILFVFSEFHPRSVNSYVAVFVLKHKVLYIPTSKVYGTTEFIINHHGYSVSKCTVEPASVATCFKAPFFFRIVPPTHFTLKTTCFNGSLQSLPLVAA